MNALRLEQVIAVQRELRVMAMASARYCHNMGPHSTSDFVRRARESTRTIIAAKRRLRQGISHA